jgi:hypothetical protein
VQGVCSRSRNAALHLEPGGAKIMWTSHLLGRSLLGTGPVAEPAGGNDVLKTDANHQSPVAMHCTALQCL